MQWVVNWHFEEQIGNSYKNNSKVFDFDGGFFSESALCFSNLKKKFKKTILSLKFKFLTNNSEVLLAVNLNIKFRIVFGIFFEEI